MANVITLEQTCECCPEQYWARKGGKIVGYIRLRWGHLTCDYLPQGKLGKGDIRVVDYVFNERTDDVYKGSFDSDQEREYWLGECKKQLMLKVVSQKKRIVMERKELLGKPFSAARQMVFNKSWPASEDELVNSRMGSFDFGFACGALWQMEHLWHDVSEEPESNSDKGIVMMLNNNQPYAGIFRGSKFLIDNKVHWEIYDGFCCNTIDLPTKWAYIEDILPIEDKEE